MQFYDAIDFIMNASKTRVKSVIGQLRLRVCLANEKFIFIPVLPLMRHGVKVIMFLALKFEIKAVARQIGKFFY